MRIQSKRLKRKTLKKIKRKNRTKKYYGGETVEENNQEDKKEDKKDSRGIYDIISEKISQFTNNTAKYAEEKGLKLFGLKKINSPDELSSQSDDKISNVASNVVNVFDKGSAAVVENINDVLKSSKVSETLNAATEETAEIGKKLLDNFNEKLNSPELKKETKEALNNVADYAEIAVKSLDKPINEAVDKLNEAGSKAASGAISGLIKVSTDAMAAVPGVGAIVELGKMANDASAAAGDIVEAASQATTSVSNIIEKSSKNIEEGVDQLKERKKEALQIANRTNKSIDTFENPLSGGQRNNTKRKLSHNSKTKRVRFAI
jgi:hypothetical protein